MRYTKEEIAQAVEDGSWPPPVMECGVCNQLLQSMFPGAFVMCKCEASFVDQTPHYSRYGGKVRPLKENSK